MAIYHCSIKIISRGKGQTAIASSAYRSGTKLLNEETGEVHDFNRKSGIVYSEILLCENAPKEYENREILWNEVQKIEKAKNAQLAREVEVALPRELTREQQIECVRNYVKENFVKEGMCADFSLHDKGDGNPHAHIMLTTRPIKDTGEWGIKERKGYALDGNGERIPLLDDTGEQKKDSRNRLQWKREMVQANDWNKREKAELWRKAWADCCNAYLPQEQQIDHRSYERQGKKQIATIHEGYVARKMEQERNQVSERCQINRDIHKLNNEQILPLEEQITRVQGEQELTLCFIALRKAQEVVDYAKKYRLDDDILKQARLQIEQASENIDKVINKAYLLSQGAKEELLEIKDSVEYTKEKIEQLLIEPQNQEFDIEQTVKELHKHYMEYMKTIIESMEYKPYRADTSYENRIEQINKLMNEYQRQMKQLKRCEQQQRELKFYQFKEKDRLKNNIDTITECINTIQLQLKRNGVNDISRADFVIKELLHRVNTEKGLEEENKALKRQLQKRMEDSKENFLDLAKQVPIDSRSVILNEMKLLRKQEQDKIVSVHEKIKFIQAEERVNQKLDGALESPIKESYQKTRNSYHMEQGFER